MGKNSYSPAPKRHGGRGAIRVVATEAIITDDNDLIVAGTLGTLISWAPAEWIPRSSRSSAVAGEGTDPVRKPEHRYVLIAWDAHMFADVPGALISGAEDNDLTGASTTVGRDWLIATAHVDSIKLHSHEGNR